MEGKENVYTAGSALDTFAFICAFVYQDFWSYMGVD
jgi:hypothetical protein